MTIEAFDSDLSAVSRTDALLDAIAAGTPPADDPVAVALGAWLAELGGSPVDTPAIALHRRSMRRRARRTAAGAALAGLVIAGAGTAAALPGTPLHRALFGTSRDAGRPVEQPTEQKGGDADGHSAAPVPVTSSPAEDQSTAHHATRPDPSPSSVTVFRPSGDAPAPDVPPMKRQPASDDGTAAEPQTSPRVTEPEDTTAPATPHTPSTVLESAPTPEPTSSGSQDSGSSAATGSSEPSTPPATGASEGSS